MFARVFVGIVALIDFHSVVSLNLRFCNRQPESKQERRRRRRQTRHTTRAAASASAAVVVRAALLNGKVEPLFLAGKQASENKNNDSIALFSSRHAITKSTQPNCPKLSLMHFEAKRGQRRRAGESGRASNEPWPLLWPRRLLPRLLSDARELRWLRQAPFCVCCYKSCPLRVELSESSWFRRRRDQTWRRRRKSAGRLVG